MPQNEKKARENMTVDYERQIADIGGDQCNHKGTA